LLHLGVDATAIVHVRFLVVHAFMVLVENALLLQSG